MLMPFGRETVLRAGAGVIAIGIILAAFVYFTFGVYFWLVSLWGIAGAAFGTSGVCALLACGVAILAFRHAPAPVVQSAQPAAALGQSSHIVSALGELAREHPLLSVCTAAVIGAMDEAKRR